MLLLVLELLLLCLFGFVPVQRLLYEPSLEILGKGLLQSGVDFQFPPMITLQKYRLLSHADPHLWL
ncbi:uncharacterized protein METZ01_LOCUS98411 [marine metagenome]|uniref:Uncharacterized protein n=1 Tax=marine metagenome TaxID=408172 RepID=A0A381W0Z3_9ZZZZ